MITLPASCVLRLGCAAALLAAATLSQAQTSSRSVRPVPQPAAPVTTPGAGFGSPSAAGLASPAPNPAGLTSRFPAGVPSPTRDAANLVPPTIPGFTGPGVAAGRPPIDGGVVPPTNVMGAGSYGGVPATPQSTGTGPGPYNALQVAQSFIGADANRDGELTRAEAQRLTVMPYSFEEMDRNRDGILTRFEYEDGVR